MEKWRAIPDWPYEASSHGRIRRVPGFVTERNGRVRRYFGERVLSPVNNRRGSVGYLMLLLSKDGVRRPFTVHKLVLLAFTGPKPSPSHEANHIDGDTLNNRPENLEWVTSSENKLHGHRTGLYPVPQRDGTLNAAAKLTEADVLAIRTQRPSTSVNELAARYGVHRATIHRVVTGRRWSHIPMTQGA